MSAAPDYVEPLVAWRAWLVLEDRTGTRLRSVVFPVSWIPGRELVAECKCRSRQFWRPWRRKRCDVAPSQACDCGIYGARDVAEAIEYLGRSLATWDPCEAVVGRVSLWGTVVEHKLGWRASRAYPARIYVPHGPRSDGVADGLGAYGVPVELLACSGRAGIRDTLGRLTAERR